MNNQSNLACFEIGFTIQKKGVSDAVFMNLEAVEAYLIPYFCMESVKKVEVRG
jgi:hypothetical protein